MTRRWFAGLSLLLIPALLTIWWDPFLAWGDAPALLLLNVVPVLLLVLVALGLLRRPLTTAVLTVAFLGFVFYVNRVKFSALNQPVVFEDFLLAEQAFRGFGLVGKYGSPILFGIGVVTAIALIVMALWREKPALKWPTGLVIALLSALLLAPLGQQRLPLGSLYYGTVLTPQDWDPVQNVKLNGLVASMTRASARTRFDHDDLPTASLPQPGALEDWAGTNGGTTTRKPDIIVVLNESFFDPAILDGVESCELLPTWCAFRDQGISGTLSVPTYGGNTTRTEFELLTGVPITTFAGLDYPYLTVVTRPVRSLIWMLRDLGYETTALHNNHGYFWNRDTAMPRLGFERFIALEDLGKRVEMGYFPDDAMLDAPLAEFTDVAADAPPQLLFVVTMENHGPWNERRRGRLPEELAEFAVPSTAAGIPGVPLQQYLFHADRSIRQFETLWRQLRDSDRDTLMVFFGDHLPALGQTFSSLGFDNGLGPVEQRTPYLVLANFPLGDGLTEEMPMHQLLLGALRAAGVRLDPEYQLMHGSWTLEQEAADGKAEALRHFREREYLRLLGAPASAATPVVTSPAQKTQP